MCILLDPECLPALLHVQLPQGLFFLKKKASIWLLALLMVPMKNKTVLAWGLCDGFVSVCGFSQRILVRYDLRNIIASVFVSSPSCELVAISSLHFEAESEVQLCCF